MVHSSLIMSTVNSTSSLKQQGNELLKNGHTKQALNKYCDAILLNPNDEKLYSNRSLCYLKLREYTKALEDGKTCIKLNPLWHKAWFRTAEAYKLLSNFKCAIITYYKASISKDIQHNNKLKKFCQKQLLKCQMLYLTNCDNNSVLTNQQMLQYMDKSLKNLNKQISKRKDIIHRMELFKNFIDTKKVMISKLKCKECFGYPNPNEQYGPKNCYGSGYCDFKMMNKAITFKKLENINYRIECRFDEWIKSGLCHICQYYIFEREIQNKAFRELKPAILHDFVWD
eukprot:195721_1